MNKVRIAAGADAPSSGETPRIKIEVSGGVVSNVESTGPAIVEIWDFDNLGEEEGEDDCAPILYEFKEGGKL
jgi:hypothetical protein